MLALQSKTFSPKKRGIHAFYYSCWIFLQYPKSSRDGLPMEPVKSYGTYLVGCIRFKKLGDVATNGLADNVLTLSFLSDLQYFQ